MTVKIDQVTLTNLPYRIVAEEPQPVAMPTAGYGKIVYVPRHPGALRLLWGQEDAAPAVVAELRTRRGQVPQHVISWTKETGTALYHRNVVIPFVPYAQTGPTVDSFELLCEEYRPNPSLSVIELWLPGTIATGDGKAKILTPAGGRIVKVDGCIATLGTGAGQTRVQVSNGATDYLTTRGDFVVASATNLMENQVLSATATFNRGDTIELDIDSIPGDSNSANAQVLLYCILFPV